MKIFHDLDLLKETESIYATIQGYPINIECRVIARKKNTLSKNYAGYGLYIVHPELGMFE